MYSEEGCLGKSVAVERLRALSDALNAEVVEQVNGSQELVMLNDFANECNKYHLKQCVVDRVSEVSSWRWVLEDLTKRLDESVEALKYERKAVAVVIQRIIDEVHYRSEEASRPGAMCPVSDNVEEAIMEEYNYLRDQKKKFRQLATQLEKQIATIEKCKNRIAIDVLNKEQTIAIDEMCANKDYTDAVIENWKKKKKKGLPLTRWMNRCAALKRAGLKSLCNALVTRQQVRGARIRLSICAQTFSSRVDAALRRRLHYNRIKLEELNWQKDEVLIDYKTLEEELESSEKSLLNTMDQERVATARIADRSSRPNRERTQDDVDGKLRHELVQLKRFAKELRKNIERIVSLQNNLREAITGINCCAEDIINVINLDESRINSRNSIGDGTLPRNVSVDSDNSQTRTKQLTVIQEETDEDNDDDYPFDE